MRNLRMAFMLVILQLANCGSSSLTGNSGDTLFPITVNEEETFLVGSDCLIDLTLSNLSSSQEYSLVWLSVTLQDQNQEEYQKVYNSEELEDLFEQVQIPPGTSLQVELSQDMSQSSLTAPPYQGSIVAIGIGGQQTVHFAGNLNCQ